jgi:hypothetical protein
MTTTAWRGRVAAVACAGASSLACLAAPAQPGPAAPALPVPEPAATAAAAREWPYRVAPGDTLIALAAAHLRPPHGWQALQSHNQVANPRRLVPGSTLRIPFDWLRRDAAVAEVVFVQGRAERTRPGAGAAEPLAPGDPVQAGDSVRTAARSALSLRFADGSRLLLVPDSQVTVERLLVYGRSGITDTGLRIERGSADTTVVPNPARAPAFEVRTPAINLGVRGTEFRFGVDADGQSARVEVLSGEVGAAAAAKPATVPRADGGDTVVVGAGFGTDAEAEGPPKPPRPLLPAPKVEPATLRVVRRPMTLRWQAVDGARRYRVQVLAEGRPDALLRDGLFAAPEAAWPDQPDLPDGRYVWRVRALDEAGLEGLDGRGGVEVDVRPDPPEPETPAPGDVFAGEAADLRWAPVDGALRYRLQLAPGGDFGAPLVDRVVEGSAVRLALSPGVYHWRVAGLAAPGSDGADRSGPFGPERAFDLRAVPELPAVRAPAFGTESMVLRWDPVVPGQGVQVQLADDAGFAALRVDTRVHGSELTVPRPPAGRYHLRLRSVIGGRTVGEFGPGVEVDVPSLPWWERLWVER